MDTPNAVGFAEPDYTLAQFGGLEAVDGVEHAPPFETLHGVLPDLQRGVARAGAVDPILVTGEIHTRLVPHSTALTRASAEEMLTIVPGYPVRWRTRPSSVGTSPTIAAGFDCGLPRVSGAAVHAIGTAAVHAVVCGGRVLQSSAHTGVVAAESSQRQVWSHYLSRVGVAEVVSRVTPQTRKRLVDGFLGFVDPPPGTVDMPSITQHLLNRVSMWSGLDQRAPFRAVTTRLRWAAHIGAAATLRFRLEEGRVRTVVVTVRNETELAAVGAFCEDLARHDWLLTVVEAITDQVDAMPLGADVTQAVAPVLAGVTHLWTPGVHTPAVLRPLWRQLEADPAFSAEWFARLGHLRSRTDFVAPAASQREFAVKTW
ncbi:SCO2521 family protein [Nocardia asteroides]|uniref:SCO2521 family protein n=1 Tax=Nocardia asteroides TaxID=1824 RepID=UPI001E479872|nr:SCO2521 family protein [Nocardia asteroides]UGT61140.1 SCO2521 family protein [Nocardia asteroides]